MVHVGAQIKTTERGDSLLAAVGEADRRMVTVLFCDLVNSSALVVSHDPEDVHALIAEPLEIMHREVERFGGAVAQRMGDGIYALFGAPHALENHGLRACAAAESIMRALRRQGMPIRIGLASGEILWRQSSPCHENPAYGRPIHLAAKLQQTATPNQIRLADSTMSLVRDWVHVVTLPPFSIGTQQIDCFALSGIRHQRLRHALPLPMVGRTRIKRTLESALKQLASSRTGTTHLISGPAGIGKSRLLTEVASIARHLGLRVIEWAMPAIDPIGSANVAASLVVELLGLPTDYGLDQIRSALAAHSTRGPCFLALQSLLADQLDHYNLSQAANDLWCLLRSEAMQQPIALFIEDLHWAGTAGQAFLKTILEHRTTSSSIAIITSSRDAELPSGLQIFNDATIQRHPLDHLSDSHAAALLRDLMGQHPSLSGLQRSLIQRTAGNPLFIVECVQSLWSHGVISGSIGNMVFVDNAPLQLPHSLNALLSERIDRLDDQARSALRAAAVIGPTFDIELLSSLLGIKTQLPAIIARLKTAGLIDESRLLPRLEYGFTHALTHEAAYQGITHGQRIKLHAHLAGLLQRPEFSGLHSCLAAQAHHAYHGELWDLALKAGQQSGVAALRQSLASEAIKLLSFAIQAHDKQGNTASSPFIGIDLLFILSKAAMPMANRQLCLHSLDQAMERSLHLGDKIRYAYCLFQKSSCELVYGSIADALDCASRGIEVLSQIGGIEAVKPEFHMIHLLALYEHGQVSEAFDKLGMIGDKYENYIADNDKERFFIMNPSILYFCIASRICYSQGRYRDALAMTQKILEISDENAPSFNRVYALFYACDIYARLGYFNESLMVASEALSISKNVDAHLLQPILLSYKGFILVCLGKVRQGMKLLKTSETLAVHLNFNLHNAHIAQCMGLALLYQGRKMAAQVYFARMQAIAGENDCIILLRDHALFRATVLAKREKTALHHLIHDMQTPEIPHRANLLDQDAVNTLLDIAETA
jgi:class 3 adenylate cyclase/tetratricopeptide (TPR) repeat protein